MKLTLASNNEDYLNRLMDSVETFKRRLDEETTGCVSHDKISSGDDNLMFFTTTSVYPVIVAPIIIGGYNVLNVYHYHTDTEVRYKIDANDEPKYFDVILDIIENTFKPLSIKGSVVVDKDNKTISGTIPPDYTLALQARYLLSDDTVNDAVPVEKLDPFNLVFLNDYINNLEESNLSTFGDRNHGKACMNILDDDDSAEPPVDPYNVIKILARHFGLIH